MNPCPCGWLGDGSGPLRAARRERVRAYRAKMSGPLLDRIDVHVVLPPVEVAALQGPARGRGRAPSVRARVERARAVQRGRRVRGRGRARDERVPRAAGPRARRRRSAPTGPRMLGAAVERLGLSARAYGKVLRVARTIADLDGVDGGRARPTWPRPSACACSTAAVARRARRESRSPDGPRGARRCNEEQRKDNDHAGTDRGQDARPQGRGGGGGEAVRQGRGDDARATTRSPSRSRRSRTGSLALDLATGHRRVPARAGRRDLRPRVERQDDARPARHRRGPARRAASRRSSTPSTRSTSRTRAASASRPTSSSSRSPTRASRRSTSPRCSSAAARSTSSSSTRSPR